MVVVSDQSGRFSGPSESEFFIYLLSKWSEFFWLFSKWSFFAVFVVGSEKSC